MKKIMKDIFHFHHYKQSKTSLGMTGSSPQSYLPDSLDEQFHLQNTG